MEKFNLEKHWNDFKEGEIAVNCKTEELAKEFLEYCEKEGLYWGVEDPNDVINTLYNDYGENTCYYYDICNEINYDGYIEYGNIVEFTGFDVKQENQINYNKTYSIQEIFELNEKFKDNNLKFIDEKDVGNKDAIIYYIAYGSLYNRCNNDCGDYVIISSKILNMKFQILKEVKYLTFQEAFNEWYNNKKTIYNDEYDTTYNDDEREYPEASMFSIEEILSNKWKIVDQGE